MMSNNNLTMNIKTITVPAVMLSGSFVLLGLTTQSAEAFTFGNLDNYDRSELAGYLVKNANGQNFQRAYNFTFEGAPDFKLENVKLELVRFESNEANILVVKGGSSTDVEPPTPDASNSISLTTTDNAIDSYSNVTFTPNDDFFFENGENYWLLVAANNDGDFGWRLGNTAAGADPVSDPTGIAQFNNFTADLGSGWSTNTGISFNGTGGRGLFQLNATKVPEPSNLVGLFTVVALGMMSFKRQK